MTLSPESEAFALGFVFAICFPVVIDR